MFSAHFDAKQCMDSFQQPHICDPSSVLCSVAFRSSFIRRLLLDPDSYGGNDPAVLLPLFYRQVALELALKLAVIFRYLVRRGSFPTYCRLTDFPVAKKSASYACSVESICEDRGWEVVIFFAE